MHKLARQLCYMALALFLLIPLNSEAKRSHDGDRNRLLNQLNLRDLDPREILAVPAQVDQLTAHDTRLYAVQNFTTTLGEELSARRTVWQAQQRAFKKAWNTLNDGKIILNTDLLGLYTKINDLKKEEKALVAEKASEEAIAAKKAAINSAWRDVDILKGQISGVELSMGIMKKLIAPIEKELARISPAILNLFNAYNAINGVRTKIKALMPLAQKGEVSAAQMQRLDFDVSFADLIQSYVFYQADIQSKMAEADKLGIYPSDESMRAIERTGALNVARKYAKQQHQSWSIKNAKQYVDGVKDEASKEKFNQIFKDRQFLVYGQDQIFNEDAEKDKAKRLEFAEAQVEFYNRIVPVYLKNYTNTNGDAIPQLAPIKKNGGIQVPKRNTDK